MVAVDDGGDADDPNFDNNVGDNCDLRRNFIDQIFEESAAPHTFR